MARRHGKWPLDAIIIFILIWRHKWQHQACSFINSSGWGWDNRRRLAVSLQIVTAFNPKTDSNGHSLIKQPMKAGMPARSNHIWFSTTSVTSSFQQKLVLSASIITSVAWKQLKHSRQWRPNGWNKRLKLLQLKACIWFLKPCMSNNMHGNSWQHVIMASSFS